jgi:glycosyltransferase involved in cell wall biosynthesis
MATCEPHAQAPRLSVIIPARNEEANIQACLESFNDQGPFPFEVIVVDDHSTDRTKEIAQSVPGVRVVDADPLQPGWTGKNNAVATGVRFARTHWFLFTDADTIHLPGSLERAWDEAVRCKVDLLSYSPEQIAISFWEKAVLPVVFAELARQYPPSKVSDPNSPEAAANGQYLLISREAYEAIGGHAAVASSILEDVALARLVKASGRKIRFRYAADAVRTRMYRNFHQLREGWTKNLALLFPDPGWLAVMIFSLWLGPWLLLAPAFAGPVAGRHWLWPLLAMFAFGTNVLRIRRSNFGLGKSVLGALVGLPFFAYLLLRSKGAHTRGHVSWKGRSYTGNEPPMTKSATRTSITSGKLA